MTDALFLDTTTQIDRIWEERVVRENIQKDFNNKKLFCSIYVKKEYKATFLNSAILYYNLLRSSRSIIEALERGEKYENQNISGGQLTPRMRARMRKILYRLYEKYGDDKERSGLRYLGRKNLNTILSSL
jgi:hypothetical protein